MTAMQEHVEYWLNEGHAAEQIIREAERMQSVRTLMELHLDDIDKSLIGGEPLIVRYGR